MIYQTPTLDDRDHGVLRMIAEQKDRLKVYVSHNPRRWFGSLRKTTFARAIQGSNSIEGYNASVDEAVNAVENDPPLDERTEIWFALKGYRDAMTYIMQAAQDPYFDLSKQFLKSLHFMMIGHEMAKNPGRWRPGSIFVIEEPSGQKVYEGPPAEQVDGLVEALVSQLKSQQGEPTIVSAAMAHLNLTMIHPFADGNGRMARALQTLILARDGAMHPVFASIEEWLGRNTQDYYAVLGSVGQGRWRPEGDALPWIRFNLKAHFQQAATLLRRNEEYETLYGGIDEIVRRERLHERTSLPLFDAALGLSLTNARYRAAAEVTEFVASRDLKRLTELGLLEPQGEKRARRYSASAELRRIRDAARIRRPLEDPYSLLERGLVPGHLLAEPRLPGL